MSNEELVSLIKEGKTEFIPQLWDQVEKFINMQAGKRSEKHPDSKDFKEDLYQSGYFAMLNAIDSYNEERGCFISYLDYHLRNTFSEALGYRTEKQRKNPMRGCISLDAPLDEFEDLTIKDNIPDPAAEEEFRKVLDMLRDDDMKVFVWKGINTLPDEIRKYFHAYMQCGMNKVKTAQALHITKGKGETLHGKGKRLLRKYFAARKDEIEEYEIITTKSVQHVGVRWWRESEFTSITEYLALRIAK